MLGHAAWVRTHSLMLAGFVALLVGLVVFRATPSLPDRTHRWTRYAIVGTALQVVDGAAHGVRRRRLDADYELALLQGSVEFLEQHFHPDFVWVHNQVSSIQESREALLGPMRDA